VALDFLLVLVSLALVAGGGNLFVDSSVNIGRAFHIPRFVVGGTLVSLATTTPELVVSTTASVLGDSGIALGSAIGSCICNIGLIIGTVALIIPVKFDQRDFTKRASWMVAGAAMVIVFSLNGAISRSFGIVLLMSAVAYLMWDFQMIRKIRARHDQILNEFSNNKSLVDPILKFVLGIVLIIVGSRLLVSSGQNVAVALGVPSAIVGFSVVSIGTSLPELVTGVIAARKGIPDLSLGNIIGANVLNLFLIIGLSSTIQPLSLDPFTQRYAFPWLVIFIAGIIVLVRRNRLLGKSVGVWLLTLYALYMFGLVVIPLLGLI
jgi:cation:H+ antiporter